jgi:hypothetical protein
MKSFRGIYVGEYIYVFSKVGMEKIVGSDRKDGTFLSQPVYSKSPNKFGKIASIVGHNSDACKIIFEEGSFVEVGLDSHIHIGDTICKKVHRR